MISQGSLKKKWRIISNYINENIAENLKLILIVKELKYGISL